MKHKRKIIYLAGFLFSMPIALVSYINSSLLENYVGRDYVGFVYALASLLSIIGLLRMPQILARFGNRKTSIFSAFFIFISFLLLAWQPNAPIVILAFITYFISVGFMICSSDIFIENFSPNSSIGTTRGFYLTIVNFSWIIAQLVSGSVISKSSFLGIYLLGASFIALLIIVFTLFLPDFKDPEYKTVPVLKTIKSFTKNKRISKIYFSSVILQLFYVWMVIYTPIYLHEYIGFNWDQIGIIFSIMLIPFVALDFSLGKLSDKIGEKRLLILGFFIITFSVFIIPFIKESVLWMWIVVLFATRVGAATIEAMNEIYFFKIITEKNSDEISFFRNAPSLSYIIASLIAFPVILLTPSFEYLYFILGVLMLVGLWNALRLIEVK
jgi:MFS family permease